MGEGAIVMDCREIGRIGQWVNVGIVEFSMCYHTLCGEGRNSVGQEGGRREM
jgi:hypothetical protein